MHSINKIPIDIQEGAELHNLFVFCPHGFIGYQMGYYPYNLITKRSQCLCGNIASVSGFGQIKHTARYRKLHKLDFIIKMLQFVCFKCRKLWFLSGIGKELSNLFVLLSTFV